MVERYAWSNAAEGSGRVNQGRRSRHAVARLRPPAVFAAPGGEICFELTPPKARLLIRHEEVREGSDDER